MSSIDPAAGALIAGRFRAESGPRARGNFAEIVPCLDERTGEKVALKLALSNEEGATLARPAADDTFRAIVREGAVLVRLQHRNVVRLIDQGQWQRRPWLALEYLTGPDLRGPVSSFDGKALVERLNVLLGAARALEAVHGAGLIHLDVKPENFLQHPERHVVAVDFGTACSPEEARVPGSGQAVTPGYSAPEQFAISGNCWYTGAVSEATDVFAFAVMGFEFLTGQHPFGVVDPGVGLRIVREPAYPSIHDLLPRAPMEFRCVLSACLQKRSPLRPELCTLREQLEEWRALLIEERVLNEVARLSASGDYALAAQEWLNHADRHRCCHPVIASTLLRPLVQYWLERGDFDQSRALLQSIEETILYGDARVLWSKMNQALGRMAEANNIPVLVERLRTLAAREEWRSHDFILGQVLAIDPNHPELTTYLFDRLQGELQEVWVEWNSGDYNAAVDRFIEVDKRYREWSRAAEISEHLKKTLAQWKDDALDGFRIRVRLRDVGGVEELCTSFSSLLHFDPDFARQVSALVSGR